MIQSFTTHHDFKTSEVDGMAQKIKDRMNISRMEPEWKQMK